MNDTMEQSMKSDVVHGPPAVEAIHLGLTYGSSTVLEDVSFKLTAGSVLGLVGRNGAGKTSLINCLLGLTVPSAGASLVMGASSLALTDRVKSELGYVAQNPELFEWLLARDHVALLGPLYPRWSLMRAEELLTRFDVPNTRVSKLSPGEKQRLAIVLALMHSPKLLVLDEPVASLDPVGRRDFLRALFDFDGAESSDSAVLISSHLLEDLERVATHLLFLKHGRVQLSGSREEIAESLVAVYSDQPLAPSAGLLHAHRLDSGGWRHVVDVRRTSEGVRSMNVHPLTLGELFIALNS